MNNTKGVLRHSSMESSNTNSSNSLTKKEGCKDKKYQAIASSQIEAIKCMRQSIKKIKSEIRRVKKMVDKLNFDNANKKVSYIVRLVDTFKIRYLHDNSIYIYEDIVYEIIIDFLRIHIMSSLIMPRKPSEIMDEITNDWCDIYNQFSDRDSKIDNTSNGNDISNIINRIGNALSCNNSQIILQKVVYNDVIETVVSSLFYISKQLDILTKTTYSTICTSNTLDFNDVYKECTDSYERSYEPISDFKYYYMPLRDINCNDRYHIDILKKVIEKSYFKDFYNDLVVCVRANYVSLDADIRMNFTLDSILDPDDGSILLNNEDISKIVGTLDISNNIKPNSKHIDGVFNQEIFYIELIHMSHILYNTEHLYAIKLPLYLEIDEAIESINYTNMLYDHNYVYKIISDYVIFNDTTDSVPIQNIIQLYRSIGDDNLTKSIQTYNINKISDVLYTFIPYQGVRNISYAEDGIMELLKHIEMQNNDNDCDTNESDLPLVTDKYIILYGSRGHDNISSNYLKYYINNSIAIGKISINNIENDVPHNNHNTSSSYNVNRIKYSIDSIYDKKGLIIDNLLSKDRVYNVIDGKSVDIIRQVEEEYSSKQYSRVSIGDNGTINHIDDKDRIPLFDYMFDTLEDAVEWCANTVTVTVSSNTDPGELATTVDTGMCWNGHELV